ncbi:MULTISPECIES: alpha/beta fold hydrolase [unclassified Frankia]|uniref:alpha/beta hydrolase family protein n=1 Tax=unclassified Frankia TaxID=2632575 RepID=UPI002AD51BBB|nr:MULTISPECIES: alpha/beta fold hydrolase [unclassified Frankia]
MSVSSTGRDTPDGNVTRRPSEFAALEAIPVTTDDNVTFVIRVLPQDDPTVPVALILPAMALKAKFYLPLAKTLHASGLSVAMCDLRAQGESTPGLDKKSAFGYREILEVDFPAVIKAVRSRFPQAPLYLFGHSLGGQLSVLYAASAPEDVAGVCIIGAGSVYWKAFGPKRWEALWKIQTIGLIARLRGYWPGGMLIGGAMAGGVMIDWARHSRTSRYQPRGTKRDYDQLLSELAIPVLAISLDGDRLGPRSNVDFLCGRMRSAKITPWHLDDSAGVAHLDHFEWIKDSGIIGSAAASWIIDGQLPAPSR